MEGTWNIVFEITSSGFTYVGDGSTYYIPTMTFEMDVIFKSCELTTFDPNPMAIFNAYTYTYTLSSGVGSTDTLTTAYN